MTTRTFLAVGLGAAALAILPLDSARAEPVRKGAQIEGLLGGAGCLPGRAPCQYDRLTLDGSTRPSFGLGATLGWRAARWMMLGAGYRFGMMAPTYSGPDSRFTYGAQHTLLAIARPILPIWRLDLGLNLGLGYSRQVFRHRDNPDRQYSQGFAMMVGPTIDVFITDRFFLGAEVDFILNTQRRVCDRNDDLEVCSVNPERALAPTHQALFGLHLGGTLW